MVQTVSRQDQSAPEMAHIYLGNVHESADLTQRVAQARSEGCCFDVVIEQCDRPKGRFLAADSCGHTVGIVKDRDWLLRDGDVLTTDQNHMVLVMLEEQTVLRLQLAPDSNNQEMALMNLGHVLGNYHWPIQIRGNRLYVDLVEEVASMKKKVKAAARSLGISGLVVGTEVRPRLATLEFSGAGHAH